MTQRLVGIRDHGIFQKSIQIFYVPLRLMVGGFGTIDLREVLQESLKRSDKKLIKVMYRAVWHNLEYSPLVRESQMALL